MRMKKIRIFFSALVTLAVAAACQDKEEIEGSGNGFNQATFAVSTVSVGNTSVTVQTSVTGNLDATYYGFLTEDVTTNVSSLVSKTISGMSVTRHILSTGTTEVTKEGLRPGGKAYRYIVTGLLANGATYNDPVFVDFETTGNLTNNSVGTIEQPNPVPQPTTFKFSGFPGKYVYGYTDDTTFDVAALKKVMNENLDSGKYDSAEEDATITFPIEESGSYVVYAYELDENDYPTLSCKIVPVTVGTIDTSAYEAFLGTWYFDGADGDTITIAEKDKNMSFYIKGLPTAGLPTSLTEYEDAVAEFDFESKTLTFKEQDLSTFVITQYGDCMKSVTGVFTYGTTNYNYYPFNADVPQTLFTGVVNENGDITVTAGAGDYGPFIGFRYAWYILEGENAGKGNSSSVITPIPAEFTKEVKEAPVPSEEYNKWIGTWYTEDGDALVIAEDVINTSYTVSGFLEGLPPVKVRFLEDGSIEFYGQVIDSDDTYTYVFYGTDQDDYVESGDQDGSSRLAKAVISSAGNTATITGCEYVATYSGTQYDEIITALTIFAINAQNKIYTVGALNLTLPATLSTTAPTAVSSVKKSSSASFLKNIRGIYNSTTAVSGKIR